MYQDLYILGSIVIDLLDLDLPLVIGCQDGIDDGIGGGPERYLGDDQCLLIDLADLCPGADLSPACPVIVF